jgi:hypothetical protein
VSGDQGAVSGPGRNSVDDDERTGSHFLTAPFCPPALGAVENYSFFRPVASTFFPILESSLDIPNFLLIDR